MFNLSWCFFGIEVCVIFVGIEIKFFIVLRFLVMVNSFRFFKNVLICFLLLILKEIMLLKLDFCIFVSLCLG